jgi:hypothetical protein
LRTGNGDDPKQGSLEMVIKGTLFDLWSIKH